jgi:hypothetical protein
MFIEAKIAALPRFAGGASDARRTVIDGAARPVRCIPATLQRVQNSAKSAVKIGPMIRALGAESRNLRELMNWM